MKAYAIVFSMLAVLAVLFLITPYFRKREQGDNKKEIAYYELLKKYQESKNNTLYEELEVLAGELFKLKSEIEIANKIASDLKAIRL